MYLEVFWKQKSEIIKISSKIRMEKLLYDAQIRKVKSGERSCDHW